MNWLRNFMAGRYGGDQLNIALIVLYLILAVIAQITQLWIIWILEILLLAFCIFRIAHYALVVVNIGERSVINIDPGRTGGANEPRAGIVYLVALLCALAAQIRRQILAAEE